MNSESYKGRCRFELRQRGDWADTYYIDRISDLENALVMEPARIQIDIIGEGQVPADTALLIRSILNERPRATQLITNARSSLCGGSVLIWLLGEKRKIRSDAKLFFRNVDASEISEVKPDEPWIDPGSADIDSDSAADPGEDEYARVLELINEYLPVSEMAGRLIGVPVLKQFGLVDNEALDQFLADRFRVSRDPETGSANDPERRKPRLKPRTDLSDSLQS